MRHLITILALLICVSADAQLVPYPSSFLHGDSTTLDSNAGGQFIALTLAMPFYASADTTLVLAVDAFGNVVQRHVHGSGGGAVSSVNGYTGAVDLTTDDIPQGIDNLYWDYADTGTGQVHGILTYTKSLIPTYLAGYGMGIAANKTFYIDTTHITSRDRAQELADSVAALIPDVSNFPTYGDLNDTAIARAATAQTNLVDTAAAHLALIVSKQPQLNGTGFAKATGTTISYDNSSYYLASNPANYISSVNIAAGTGISVAGSVGNYTISNTLPDQTVTLTSGTGISATGVYPNFTITNTSPSSGGTVTSVGAVAGTGISITGTSPITSSGTFTVVNTAPDKTVTITGGAGLTVSSAYPSFTLTPTGVNSVVATGVMTATGTSTVTVGMPAATTSNGGYITSSDWNTFNGKGSGTVTSVGIAAGTGISVSGSPVTSSGVVTVTATGSLAAGTGISVSGSYPNFTVTNTLPDQTVNITAGTGVTVTGSYPSYTVAASAIAVRSITATSPLHVSGTSTVNVTIDQATTSVSGYLSSTDWNTFNGKGSGTVTSVGLVGSSTMSVTGTASPITGAGTYSLAIPASVPLAGSPTTTTQSAGDNSTKIATTAYVDGIGVQTITATSYTTSCTITTSLTAVTATVFFDVTAQAGPLLFNNPTGTWANHQLIQITVKDNGTARALTYGTKFVNGTSPVLPTTTTISKMLTLLFQYDAIADKFRLQGYIDGQ